MPSTASRRSLKARLGMLPVTVMDAKALARTALPHASSSRLDAVPALRPSLRRDSLKALPLRDRQALGQVGSTGYTGWSNQTCQSPYEVICTTLDGPHLSRLASAGAPSNWCRAALQMCCAAASSSLSSSQPAPAAVTRSISWTGAGRRWPAPVPSTVRIRSNCSAAFATRSAVTRRPASELSPRSSTLQQEVRQSRPSRVRVDLKLNVELKGNVTKSVQVRIRVRRLKRRATHGANL